MGEPVDVDRLIEDGLTLYGQGNLDAALKLWERALAMDPANDQATSYVEYVRQHYDMLTGVTPGDESDSPYAIEDDEYQVEIIETPADGGEASPRRVAPLDEGWFLEEDGGRYPAGHGNVQMIDEDEEEPGHTIEMTADEPDDHPPATPEPATIEMTADEPPPPGFEDETREYIGAPREASPRRETIDPGVAEFSDSPDSNPVGFSQQTTNIKPRNLGFVKPTDSKPPTEPPRTTRKKTEPPELKMTLRTPPPPSDPPSDPSLKPQPVDERTNYGPAPRESDPMIQVTYDSTPPPDVAPGYSPRTISVDLSPSNIALTSAPTTDLKIDPRTDDTKRTRDMIERETQKLPPIAKTLGLNEDPLVGAPTRELGLKEKALASSKSPTTPLPMNEDTRTDTKPPVFDPVDERSQQILDDVDQGAPANEAKDDRTRRRITGLLDRAADWHRQGELDKAVTAVDLALGEDPNTALAQKLIHRNRDTIMTVFQAFLGDLQRTPVLARPLHELSKIQINPRAAFLLSRIDGTLSIDETLDVSGMPRLEAYRYLCQLLLRGIIR